ncbi:MAG: hypothetical protein K0U20_09330 [Proteobacteria bacterium]|nr:hypothetical protein [Pseudomonadota bacterium]MCH9735782.1 hypothetical protein [Actinomycetes bacterium]
MNENIQQINEEIETLEKAIAISKAMQRLSESDDFKLVFKDNFIKAYRDTAVVNIGLVRADAQEGIKVGLIGRAHFEAYCEDLVEPLPQLEDGLKELKEALEEEEKLEASQDEE